MESAHHVKHRQLLVETACKLVEIIAQHRCFPPSFNDITKSDGMNAGNEAAESRFGMFVPSLYSLRSSVISSLLPSPLPSSPLLCSVSIRIQRNNNNNTNSDSARLEGDAEAEAVTPWLLLERWVLGVEGGVKGGVGVTQAAASASTTALTSTHGSGHTAGSSSEHMLLKEVYHACSLCLRAVLAAVVALPASNALLRGIITSSTPTATATATATMTSPLRTPGRAHAAGQLLTSPTATSDGETGDADDWLLMESSTRPAGGLTPDTTAQTEEGMLFVTHRLQGKGVAWTVRVAVQTADGDNPLAQVAVDAASWQEPCERSVSDTGEVNATVATSILRIKERAFSGVRTPLGRMRLSVQYREDAQEAIRRLQELAKAPPTAAAVQAEVSSSPAHTLPPRAVRGYQPPVAGGMLRYTPFVGAVTNPIHFPADLSLGDAMGSQSDAKPMLQLVSKQALSDPEARAPATVLGFLTSNRAARHREGEAGTNSVQQLVQLDVSELQSKWEGYQRSILLASSPVLLPTSLTECVLQCMQARDVTAK